MAGSDCFTEECVKICPPIHPGVIIGLKVVVGIVGFFSILGAGVIIITYFAFRNLQTTARQLLVNISIADILTVISQFVGVLVNYERFIPYYNGNSTVTSTDDPVCVSQAAVAVFGGMSSLLWTIAIAVYVLALTVLSRKVLKVMVIFMYVICWGLPLVLTIWTIKSRLLGVEYAGSPGCYMIKRNKTDSSADDAARYLSYEVWAYMAYLFLPITYVVVFCYIRCSYNKLQLSADKVVSKTDIKLLLIPILFFLLRVWATVDDSISYYHLEEFNKKYRCSNISTVILFFENVGNNAQGVVNSILFCLLTRNVRQRWFQTFSRLCRCNGSHNDAVGALLVNKTEDSTTKYDYSSINN